MSDHMKEAERLIECLRCSMTAGSWDEYRAALLAHIQRGAVPDGWQLVPKEPTPEMQFQSYMGSDGPNWPERQAIYKAMLAAAPTPGDCPNCFEGKSDMDHTCRACGGSGKAAALAGVPMPEPDVTTLYSYTDSTGEPRNLAHTADQMRTYGDAREAAGYAQGLAAAGRDAERRGQFLVECDDVALRVGPAHLGLCDAIDNDGQPYQSQALADEITALRGEAKP